MFAVDQEQRVSVKKVRCSGCVCCGSGVTGFSEDDVVGVFAVKVQWMLQSVKKVQWTCLLCSDQRVFVKKVH